MEIPSWQLQTPIDAVVFDCDGTLSTIEGIDELAQYNGVSEEVKALTAEAMGKTGLNLSLYQKRLDLARPTHAQVLTIGSEYYAHQASDAKAVIQLFQRLNKSVYIISAGVQIAVEIFGELMGVPRQNIFAVNIFFDSEGHYQDFDRTTPFATVDGKRIVISEFKKKHRNILFIGDGLNDISAKDLVTRFVGYGGSYFRENIARLCKFYINTSSMSPLLALSLTQSEIELLSTEEMKIYQKGLDAIRQNKVMFNE